MHLLTGSLYIGCTGTSSWFKKMASATAGPTHSKQKEKGNFHHLFTFTETTKIVTVAQKTFTDLSKCVLG